MMRDLSVSLSSFVLTTVVIANAYLQKKQFYPTVVHITKSNPSMAVIYTQALVCVVMCAKIMRKIFFGQLRTTEVEHLIERSWYAVTETCLAFTVFKDDFSINFAALFTLLLFLKSFHWLAEDRIDYMERSPVISYVFHARVLSLLIFLYLFDLHFIYHAYHSTMTKGASVQLVFGFEYVILLTILINLAIKYTLHYYIDMTSETSRDNKSILLLYTELILGLVKVALYCAFATIMVRMYTVPLFALRPMYYAVRSLRKAFSDVILSRRAIHNMNTLYANVSGEELRSGDNVCIICREEMTTAAKKLPCNHIFHAACLRSWFQRQQTCPTCRLDVLRTSTLTPPLRNAQNPRANRLFLGHNVFDNLERNRDDNQPQGQANNVLPSLLWPPFWPPPPLVPPQNFASMSTEELLRLERMQRDNIEARIQCLRNIKTLLDSALVMMHQYSIIAVQIPPATASSNIFATSNSPPTFWNSPTLSESASKVAKVAPSTSCQQVSASCDCDPSLCDLDGPSTSKVEAVVQSEEMERGQNTFFDDEVLTKSTAKN